MKKFLIVAFGICIATASLAAGGRGELRTNEPAPAEIITVTDDRGVEVQINVPVERVVTFPLPLPHLIASIDGGLNRVVGASVMSVSAAEVSVFGKMHPELFEVETAFLDGQTLNVEELARIQPDVFFTNVVLDGMDNLEQLGIPVVYLSLSPDSVRYRGEDVTVISPKRTMIDWVATTAAVLQRNESNALEIERVWEETEDQIRTTIEAAGVDNPPRILIMFQTRGLTVAGEGTFGHYWIAATGGHNAAELRGQHPAFVKVGNFEEIMRWNPDIIYLSNFEDTTPEDLLENRIPGQDWSQIEAIRTGRVHRIPLGIYRWYPPSLDGPLMLKWMAQMNYPELFDWDMREEIREYFSRFHGYDLNEEELDSILDPMSSGNL